MSIISAIVRGMGSRHSCVDEKRNRTLMQKIPSCRNGDALTDKLKALGVRVLEEDPYTVLLQPADTKVVRKDTKANEVYRKRTDIKTEEAHSSTSANIDIIRLESTPKTSSVGHVSTPRATTQLHWWQHLLWGDTADADYS